MNGFFEVTVTFCNCPPLAERATAGSERIDCPSFNSKGSVYFVIYPMEDTWIKKLPKARLSISAIPFLSDMAIFTRAESLTRSNSTVAFSMPAFFSFTMVMLIFPFSDCPKNERQQQVHRNKNII